MVTDGVSTGLEGPLEVESGSEIVGFSTGVVIVGVVVRGVPVGTVVIGVVMSFWLLEMDLELCPVCVAFEPAKLQNNNIKVCYEHTLQYVIEFN